MRAWIERAAMLLVVLLLTAGESSAGMVTYLGTTIGQLTWNRPNAGDPPIPPVSGIGTAVPYSVQEFTVSQSGAYDFISSSVIPTDWDNNLYLYQAEFNPLTPLNNIIVGNDDFPDVGRSGFNSVNLSAATSYFLVTTGFNNASSGSYSNTVTGPGDIVLIAPVPEPSSMVLLAVSACSLYASRRIRGRRLFSAGFQDGVAK